MGRYESWDKKRVVEDYIKIDLAGKQQYIKNGYADLNITWGPNSEYGTNFVIDLDKQVARFSYSKSYSGGEKQSVDYQVPLEATACHFGGKRYWFKCQGAKHDGHVCNKRIRALFLGGDYFICRNCLELSYKSRQRKESLIPEIKLLSKYFDYLSKLESLVVRKKYYKGKLTKKYTSYLKVMSKLEQETNECIDKLALSV